MNFAYSGDKRWEDLNFGLEEGKIYALLGRNGSGKSTVLRLLTGILRPQGGEILWMGKRLDRMTPGELSRYVATVWTRPPAGEMKVSEILKTAGNFSSALWSRVSEELALEPLMQRSVASLSDGERQRVMLGRARLTDAPVLLLDEPLAHLDLPNKAGVLAWLQSAASEGKTVLFSTHEPALVRDVADAFFLLDKGKLSMATGRELLESLQRIFRHKFLTFDKECGYFKMKRDEH